MKRNIQTILALAGLLAIAAPTAAVAGGPGKGNKETKSKTKTEKQTRTSIAIMDDNGHGKGGKTNGSATPNQSPNQSVNTQPGQAFEFEDYVAMKKAGKQYEGQYKSALKACVKSRQNLNWLYRDQYNSFKKAQRHAKSSSGIASGSSIDAQVNGQFFIHLKNSKSGVTKTYAPTTACYRYLMYDVYGACETFGEKLGSGSENKRFENKWSKVEFTKDAIARIDSDGDIYRTCDAIGETRPNVPANSNEPEMFRTQPIGEGVNLVQVGPEPVKSEPKSEVQPVAPVAENTNTVGSLESEVKVTTPGAAQTSPAADQSKAPIAANVNQKVDVREDDIAKLKAEIADLKDQVGKAGSDNADLRKQIADKEKQLKDCEDSKIAVEAPKPQAEEVNAVRTEVKTEAPIQASDTSIEFFIGKVSADAMKNIQDFLDLNKGKYSSVRVHLGEMSGNETVADTKHEEVTDNTIKKTEDRVIPAPTVVVDNGGNKNTDTTQPVATNTSGTLEEAQVVSPRENFEEEAPVPTTPEVVAPVSPIEPVAPVAKVSQPKAPKKASKPKAKTVAKKSNPELDFSHSFDRARDYLCKDLKNYSNYTGGSCQFVATVVNNMNSKWYKNLKSAVKKAGHTLTVEEMKTLGFFNTKPDGTFWTVVGKDNKDGIHFDIKRDRIVKKGTSVKMRVM
ncbi:MAG: hypothetical protein EOP09_01445 [Proteobacteria bacterium]|nr:MAG: hypothetical protein EOP09_01445 [Pseudomonadota bacterium]